ncbi:MAG: prolipoprotein diacylglyceryl transferase [Dehalococcoidia bacterium]|jgi:phosphatidylglycerol:prolipoprotein diacylglycerol transferase|nr:prolipoprotein diacylglyceryl transferase [Dehalococcoidia bacterium]
MLTISIDPIAFNIGSLEIRWYGIMVALGVASLLVIMLKEAKRRAIPRDIYGIFFWGVVGGLVGGRLAYVIYYWEDFMANPRQIIGFQGLAQMGMIVGIVVAALIYMGVTRMRFSTLLSIGDAFMAGALLALAIGRIGCTLNGCCYGQPSPFHFFPLAIMYTPHDTIPPQYWNVPLYPTQIYHVFWNLIVFATVWLLRRKFKPAGSLVFFGFSIYAIGDLALRFLRGGRGAILFWGLDNPQVVDLALIVIFLPWLIFKMRRFHEQASVAEMASQAETGQNREG